jgi:hypothetical protein
VLPRLTACLFIVSLVLVGAASAAPSACFTPDEAKAARFRVLQQELNVAALSCQTLDPKDPTFHDRYNQFVNRFGGKLQENAQALRRHFARIGGDLDAWMTRVGNDANQRVFTDENYCQRAWEHLAKVVAVEPKDVEGFAATAETSQAYVVACSEAKPAAGRR